MDSLASTSLRSAMSALARWREANRMATAAEKHVMMEALAHARGVNAGPSPEDHELARRLRHEATELLQCALADVRARDADVREQHALARISRQQQQAIGPAVQACDACARLCEGYLERDPSYLAGSSRFTAEQVALVTCADACQRTARALQHGDQPLDEVCAWCAEACQNCLTCVASPRGPEWRSVASALLHCADACLRVTFAGK